MMAKPFVHSTTGGWERGVDPDDGREYYEIAVRIADSRPDGSTEYRNGIVRHYTTYHTGDDYNPDEIMYTLTLQQNDESAIVHSHTLDEHQLLIALQEFI